MMSDAKNPQELERERRDKITTLAEKLGKNSRILRLARKLHLRPIPTGEDEYSWDAQCPWCSWDALRPWRYSHKLIISTKTESFSCVNCERVGNTKELEKFFKEAVKSNFAPLVELVEQKLGSRKKLGKIIAKVSWYDDLIEVTLKLSKKEWEKILTGLPFDKKGQGFSSEEGSHNDLWRFNLDWPGSLEVDYGAPGDADDSGGQGFIGSFADASIEVEPSQDRSGRSRRRRDRGKPTTSP
jgi:hypothetical protein